MAPGGEVLWLLHEAHRRMSTIEPESGLAAASVAGIECAVHLVRASVASDGVAPASTASDRGRDGADPVAAAMDALGAARAAVTAATFAVRSVADLSRACPRAGGATREVNDGQR